MHRADLLPRWRDAMLAVALLSALAAERSVPGVAGGVPTVEAESRLAIAWTAVLCIATAWWRIPWLIAPAAIGALLLSPVAPLDGALTFTVAIAISAFAIGYRTEGRSAVVGAVAVGAMFLLGLWRPGSPTEELSDAAAVGFVVLGPWLAGIALRERRHREDALERRAAAAEEDRAHLAREAVVHERTRIARELHDVVAHAISVIILQERGARHALADDPAAVRDALGTIESTATDALDEMRRLVGILRADGDEPSLAPQPGLALLPDLVGEFRAAGLPVDLSVEGEPTPLSPGLDLTAFRIVQEALSNVAAHAGPAAASITVRYGNQELELDIEDTGRGRPLWADDGNGLVGMRERATMYGGQLHVGPGREGGYVVQA